jgi:hypothetical protein
MEGTNSVGCYNTGALQIFAWLTLPAPVVIVALLVHVCIVYRTVLQVSVGILISLPVCTTPHA